MIIFFNSGDVLMFISPGKVTKQGQTPLCPCALCGLNSCGFVFISGQARYLRVSASLATAPIIGFSAPLAFPLSRFPLLPFAIIAPAARTFRFLPLNSRQFAKFADHAILHPPSSSIRPAPLRSFLISAFPFSTFLPLIRAVCAVCAMRAYGPRHGRYALPQMTGDIKIIREVK
jgi:hypothetical protein